MPMMGKKMAGPAKKYQRGGRVRQGMQSPAAGRARSDMAQDVMRRERARETVSDAERMRQLRESEEGMGSMGDEIRNMMRRQGEGFKKGGKVPAKPAKPVKMQKGGMVPCKGCPNPAACRRAGRCMMAG